MSATNVKKIGGIMNSNASGERSLELGVFVGTGAPDFYAAQGSLYLRTDGSSASTRLYVNSDGGTTWVAVTTAS